MSQSLKVTEYEVTDAYTRYDMPAPADNEICVVVSANMYKYDTILDYIREKVREAILACEAIEGLGMVISIKENDSPTFEEIKRQINDQRANALVVVRPKQGVFYRCAIMSDWCKFDGQTYKFSELVAVFSTIDSLLAGLQPKEIEDNEVVLKVHVVNPNSLLVTTEHGTIHCTSNKFSSFSAIKLQRVSNNE
jgi:hypothetical protein